MFVCLQRCFRHAGSQALLLSTNASLSRRPHREAAQLCPSGEGQVESDKTTLIIFTSTLAFSFLISWNYLIIILLLSSHSSWLNLVNLPQYVLATCVSFWHCPVYCLLMIISWYTIHKWCASSPPHYFLVCLYTIAALLLSLWCYITLCHTL